MIKPAIDIDFLRSMTINDAVFERELLVLFLDSSKTNVIKIEKALVGFNNNDWYMASHSMKGASASIGAFDLAKVMEYSQTQFQAEQKVKVKILVDIKTELDKVIAFINDVILKQK